MDGKFICYGAYTWSKGLYKQPQMHGMEIYDYTQNAFKPFTLSNMTVENERFIEWPWKHLVLGRGQLSNEKETIPMMLNIINDDVTNKSHIPFQTL